MSATREEQIIGTVIYYGLIMFIVAGIIGIWIPFFLKVSAFIGAIFAIVFLVGFLGLYSV